MFACLKDMYRWTRARLLLLLGKVLGALLFPTLSLLLALLHSLPISIQSLPHALQLSFTGSISPSPLLSFTPFFLSLPPQLSLISYICIETYTPRLTTEISPNAIQYKWSVMYLLLGFPSCSSSGSFSRQ